MEDQMKGAAKGAGGKMKEVAGKMTDEFQNASGSKVDRATGKAQNTVGGIKNAMKK